ncbi:MAG: cache domain-containing sensor histidine kinase [Tuberibacillus sp.]
MYRRFMNLSLKTKLMMLFTIIAVIPLSFLGYFTYEKTTELLSEQVSDGALQRLGQVNRNMLFFLNDIDQMTGFISLNNDVQDILTHSENRDSWSKYQDNQSIQSLFDIVKGSKNWDINIYLIGMNGDRYFTGKYLPQGYDDYMQNWGVFRKAKQANGTLAWDTHYSILKLNNEDVVLSAGRVIKDPETEQLLGYIVVDIMEPAIANIYQTEEYTKIGSQLFLLDNQGNIISSYPSKVTVGTRLDHSSLDRILSSDKGYTRSTWKGKPVMVVYDTVDNGQFKSVSFIPIEEITRQNALIKLITFSVICIGLIIALWISYFLSSSITRPFNILMRSMKKVENGDLAVSFQPKYKDEVGVLASSFNRMVSQLQFHVKDSIEKQTMIKESEIKALRAQINPHFLYNTLETIRWITKLNGLQAASDMTVALGEMFRYSLKSGNRLVSLSEEITHIKHYLFIQQMRFNDKFEVTYHFNIAPDLVLVPSLVLQPLVENAILHGLEMKLDKGHLKIEAHQDENHLLIIIEDDGLGINKDILPTLLDEERAEDEVETNGIGLNNVHRRIRMRFGNPFGLVIHSQTDKGTTVTVRLPMIWKEEERC